jgi:hypothetical protein
MKTAELVIARTSAQCISYRLYSVPAGITEPPALLWSNRVYDRPEGHAGARRRAQQWCLAHGYQLVEAHNDGSGVSPLPSPHRTRQAERNDAQKRAESVPLSERRRRA